MHVYRTADYLPFPGFLKPRVHQSKLRQKTCWYRQSNNAIPSLGTSLNRRLFLHFELWRPPFPSRCQSHSVSPRIPSLKIELQSPIGTPSREPKGPFLSPAKAGRKERGRVTYLFGLRPCLHWVRTTMRRETWPSRVYANYTPSVHGVIWKFISKKCLTAA